MFNCSCSSYPFFLPTSAGILAIFFPFIFLAVGKLNTSWWPLAQDQCFSPDFAAFRAAIACGWVDLDAGRL